MQGIGESEAGAPPRQRRLQVRPVFNAETGGMEELIEQVLEASTARPKQVSINQTNLSRMAANREPEGNLMGLRGQSR